MSLPDQQLTAAYESQHLRQSHGNATNSTPPQVLPVHMQYYAPASYAAEPISTANRRLSGQIRAPFGSGPSKTQLQDNQLL